MEISAYKSGGFLQHTTKDRLKTCTIEFLGEFYIKKVIFKLDSQSEQYFNKNKNPIVHFPIQGSLKPNTLYV